MGKSFKRFARVFLSVLLATALSQYGDNQYYLALAPILSAFGKYLRHNNPEDWSWLPF